MKKILHINLSTPLSKNGIVKFKLVYAISLIKIFIYIIQSKQGAQLYRLNI